MPIKRHFALRKQRLSLQGEIFAVVSTLIVDFNSKFASIREELAVDKDAIGKLRAEVRMIYD